MSRKERKQKANAHRAAIALVLLKFMEQKDFEGGDLWLNDRIKKLPKEAHFYRQAARELVFNLRSAAA